MKQKILFLAANPTNETRLALDKECREIETKIRASEHRDSLELLTKWAVRPNDLLQYLHQHSPHIVHFSGHGSRSEELILLDAHEEANPVSKAALKQLFTTLKDNIRVVVLNACFSQPQAEAIAESKHRIPFRNMIHVGDGITEIPCFSLVKRMGGTPFGVFHPNQEKSARRAFLEFLKTDRVGSCHAPRYRKSDELGSLLRTAVAARCSQIDLERQAAVSTVQP